MYKGFIHLMTSSSASLSSFKVQQLCWCCKLSSTCGSQTGLQWQRDGRHWRRPGVCRCRAPVHTCCQQHCCRPRRSKEHCQHHSHRRNTAGHSPARNPPSSKDRWFDIGGMGVMENTVGQGTDFAGILTLYTGTDLPH